MSSYLDNNHWQTAQLVDELILAATELRAMQVIATIKPVLSKDGNQFCYLLGENLQEGISGFGDTVAQAMYEFNRAFWNEKAVNPNQRKQITH